MREPAGTAFANVMPRSPCSTQRDPAAGLRSSALTPFAATMRPRSIGTRSIAEPGACTVDEAVEPGGIGRRDIEEEERRRLVGQRACQFAMQIAVDLDHGDKERKPEAERQHDTWRQRAGAVDIGDGEPQHGRALARQAAGSPHRQQRDEPQQQENGGGGDDEIDRDAAIVGGEDRQRRKTGDDHRRGDDIAQARPAPLGGDLIAKQHGHRNVVGAPKRPQRERERRQQAVGDRQRQHVRMQRRRDGKRNDGAEGTRRSTNGSAAPSAAPISGGEQRDEQRSAMQ